MTWDEHIAELKRLRTACEQNKALLVDGTYEFLINRVNTLEADRFCKGDNPYAFLWAIIADYTDFTPNPAEYNSAGYPTTRREARRRLRACETTTWQSGRLLGYADWIQINGWEAVHPQVADKLRLSYHNAGIDPFAIDFLSEPQTITPPKKPPPNE